jgi:hypothetical protein
MTFVGYLIEAEMHTRQAEIERHGASYRARLAARGRRVVSREQPARPALVRSSQTSPIPCVRAADVAGSC